MKTLIDLLAPPVTDQVLLSQAIVKEITSTGLVINYLGASLPDIPYLSSYNPQVGDMVVLISYQGFMVVLGKITLA